MNSNAPTKPYSSGGLVKSALKDTLKSSSTSTKRDKPVKSSN